MIDALITNSLKAETTVWLERLPYKMLDRLTADAVKWILAYTKKYGHTPTTERYGISPHGIISSDRFPKVPLEDLFDQCVTLLKREYSAAQLNEWKQRIDEEGEISAFEIAAFSNALSITTSRDEGKVAMFDKWGYEESTTPKLTLGIPTLDEVMGGIDEASYGVIAGRPGWGKTQFLCHFAYHWYSQGKKVLFVSCEMQVKWVMARLHGIMANCNPRVFLSVKGKEFDDAQWEINRLNADIRARDGLMGMMPPQTSIDEVIKQMEKWKFDIIVMDSFYLLKGGWSSDIEWQRIKSMVEKLEEVARVFQSTVVVSSQLKRTGKTTGFNLEDLAYSDSIGQSVDFAIAIGMPSRDTQVLEVIKNRNGGGFGNISVKYDWAYSRIEETSWT